MARSGASKPSHRPNQTNLSEHLIYPDSTQLIKLHKGLHWGSNAPAGSQASSFTVWSGIFAVHWCAGQREATLLLGKQRKQNMPFVVTSLQNELTCMKKIWMGNVEFCILIIYSSNVITEEMAILLKALWCSLLPQNTYANLKVPVSPYVSQLNNSKVTVFWQTFYHLVSCSSLLCPPQSCILFPTAPEPAKVVDPAKETDEHHIFSWPEE